MVRLEEVPEPVLVIRDRLGVPCLAAETEESAFFALGYVHAQDRLWQMELLRRAAWGELTSLFGPSCHAIDLWHRRIGFYRQSMEIRAELPKRTQELLHAYAKGVTAYIRAHPFRLPPAFLLSRSRPDLWKMEDVLAIGAMTQWLAVPCSLRVPPELVSGVFQVGMDRLSLRSTPDGLSLLLSDLHGHIASDGRITECQLAWGQSLPAPWHEAAMRIAGDELWRGWTIPGWPVPHVTASRDAIRALVTDGVPVDPWRRDVPDMRWTPVLEFLDESPTSGYCDTVLLSSGFSAMKGLGTGTEYLATKGAPGWRADVLTRMLGLWRDGEHGRETSFVGSPFTYVTIASKGCHEPLPGRRGSSMRRRMQLKPLIKFGILDFFFPTERRVAADVVSTCDNRSWLLTISPVVVRVEQEGQRIRAAVAGGVSDLPGSRWRMNQMSSWKRGELLERDQFFPVSGKGCMLVPVEM